MVLLVPLSMPVCVYAHVWGCEGSEAPAGLFSTEFSPEGTGAITHNSPALIGYIQLLYWKLSSLCRLQVPITSHLPFSSHYFATHVYMLTHRHTHSCSFTYVTHIYVCDRHTLSYTLCLKYLIKYISTAALKTTVQKECCCTGTTYKSKYTGTARVLQSAQT